MTMSHLDYANDTIYLNNHRQISSIPCRYGQWRYPSESQFYHTTLAKGHDVLPSDMKVVVAIHNLINETAWKRITDFEKLHLNECQSSKLIRFTGLSDYLTTRAKINMFMGYIRPFDTHEWIVDRCGKQVRYLIDYYEGPGRPLTGSPISVCMDVRPSGSFEGLYDQCRLWWKRHFRIVFLKGMIPNQFLNNQGFTTHELDLYGRQLILSEIGILGQQRLKSARVAVVGAGGLGSPACLYLASAGIGFLRIIDGDSVSVTNLHRQIIHDLNKVNHNKANSASVECLKRNNTIQIEPIGEFITDKNYKTLLCDVDVILDCTDNAKTRYFLNDVSALYSIVLVSGSALKWDGQLTVYNFCPKSCRYPTNVTSRGPCYRCICPTPPLLNNSGSCDMEGVVGPVPGIIGTMQALEAIKICLGLYDKVLFGQLLILDCLNPERMWRCVKLRHRQLDCIACGENATITLNNFDNFCPDEIYPQLSSTNLILTDTFYKAFLEIIQDKPIVSESTLDTTTPDSSNNIFCLQVKDNLSVTPKVVVIDVRPETHYNTIAIKGTLNYPITKLLSEVSDIMVTADKNNATMKGLKFFNLFHINENDDVKIFCLCRRGRDAAKATEAIHRLLELLLDHRALKGNISCMNVSGGLMGLKANIPALQNFPVI